MSGMRVFGHIHTHTYIYIYIYIIVAVDVYLYVYIYICVYVCMYVCIYIYICICVCVRLAARPEYVGVRLCGKMIGELVLILVIRAGGVTCERVTFRVVLSLMGVVATIAYKLHWVQSMTCTIALSHPRIDPQI